MAYGVTVLSCDVGMLTGTRCKREAASCGVAHKMLEANDALCLIVAQVTVGFVTMGFTVVLHIVVNHVLSIRFPSNATVTTHDDAMLRRSVGMLTGTRCTVVLRFGFPADLCHLVLTRGGVEHNWLVTHGAVGRLEPSMRFVVTTALAVRPVIVVEIKIGGDGVGGGPSGSKVRIFAVFLVLLVKTGGEGARESPSRSKVRNGGGGGIAVRNVCVEKLPQEKQVSY